MQFLLTFPLVYSYTCPSSSLSISSYNVVSDETNLVTGPDVSSQTKATASYYSWSPNITGAVWIWDSYFISNPTINQTITATKLFYISGFPISAILEIAADNYAWVNINGNTGFCDTDTSLKYCNVQKYLFPGNNSLVIIATNLGVPGSSSLSNSGGLIYKISIQVSG